MTNEKRPKPKIKRRPPGLVITPPSPRPVGDDHPARLLFREAIESAKEPAIEVATADSDAVEILDTPAHIEEPEPTSLPQSQAEPLQIFKELRETTVVEQPAGVVVAEEAPHQEEMVVFKRW
jgi:hypothetical protein